MAMWDGSFDPEHPSVQAWKEKQDSKRLIYSGLAVALAGGILGSLVTMAVPINRTVHEKKVLTVETQRTEVVKTEKVEASSVCDAGKPLTVSLINTYKVSDPTEEDKHAWHWASDVTFEDNEGAKILCKFEYVELNKQLKAGDIYKPTTGKVAG